MRFSFRKQQKQEQAFDLAEYMPVIRSSICTGEKVAGFKGADGRIHEVMLIRSEKDLEAFRKKYDIKSEIKTVY